MKTDSAKQYSSQRYETYKNIINGIEFMEKFLEDSNIFNPDSSGFKIFLIQAFSYLHSDFHYLSFLNKDDMDIEIIKAAKMLQILPVKNTHKLFYNMLEDDINKFWDKFFFLFKIKKEIDCRSNSIFTISWENKINFFKEMSGTLNYTNYEFSVVKNKKLNNLDITNEINNWKEVTLKPNTYQNKSTSFDFNEEEMTVFDSEKLLLNLRKVVSTYHVFKPIRKPVNPEYLDFFTTFVSLTKNVIEYKKNITIITSANFNAYNCNMVLNDVILSGTLHFLKRCNNLINILKSTQFCVLKI